MIPVTRIHSAVKMAALLLVLLLLNLSSATTVFAQPGFTAAFIPNTIGPGSVSTLRYTFDNAEGTPTTDLAFTNVLPAAVTIATPANVMTTCLEGTVTAPDGGTTISFADGALPGNQSCYIEVNVTSSTPGIHTTTTGDLTSSAGNSGTATADLTVDTSRPGFSKSFSLGSVNLGGRATLTFTIDNTLNPSDLARLVFTDNLPTGLVIADPANSATTCEGPNQTFTADPNSDIITFSSFGSAIPGFEVLSAGETCTIIVDVIATGAGGLINVTSELTTSTGGSIISAGKASDILNVTADVLTLTKSFTNDPVNPGQTVELEFTLTNFDRANPAADITFTDDLDATLSGLVATGLPAADVCGPGSSLTGTSVLTLSNGSLAAGETCTFSVTLQVPPGAAAGSYPNTTSTVSGLINGENIVGSPASELLVVNFAPQLTKTFLTNPAGAGDTIAIEFTITNSSATASATDIAFQDDLGDFLSGVSVAGLPPNGFCGAGSIAFITSESSLNVSGGNLAAGAFCTFTVDILLPVGAPQGSYPNTTTPISGSVDGTTQTGKAATDVLTIVAAPTLRKSFSGDPVLPGGTVTLEFTLEHAATAPAAATEITFTDDLDAVLSGLTAVGLPLNDICGPGSQLSGTSLLTLSSGTLDPGQSCTVSVTLSVPAAVPPGSYTNTSSNVTAVVDGVATTGNPATDDLDILGLTISKTFTDDPALPGDIVTLAFTIDNSASTVDATDIVFTDNLNGTLSGLTAVAPLPTEPCGAGSTISGTTFLILSGGNLLAGESCTFEVSVQVPGSAADGDYINTTSNPTATVGGSTVVLDPAVDTLTITSDLLFLTKEFTDDPVAPGGTVTLEFNITNVSADDTITAITFTDDLDAALAGLVATGLPAGDLCGAGSTLSGTSVLTLTGGTLTAGATCTFTVTLQLPAAVPAGTTATNTTSSITGSVGGTGVTGFPATDDLQIDQLLFSKSFSGAAQAGGTVQLIFEIENLSDTNTISALSFTDDLDAVLSGLTAANLPAEPCGAGSMLSGTSFLNFADGTLDPGQSCTFAIDLQLPAAAAPGTYPNTSSDLFSSGLPVALAATADLTVEPPPTFSKTFAPDLIPLGDTTTLTFVIDNTASTLSANNMSFTDNLPAGLVVADVPNAATSCLGGALTAVPASAVVSYTGGAVAAGASCTLSVDVTGTAAGSLVNTTSDLTSTAGSSGTATATLTVSTPPTFTKAFSPTTILVGELSTLTFTIDNSVNGSPATGLDFTDDMPPAMAVAPTPNASTTCTGGTLTAVPGNTLIIYTGGSVAAGATCTISVDVISRVAGVHTNISRELTTSLGSGGEATAALTVNPPPGFSQRFEPAKIDVGESSMLIMTINNSASTLPAANVAFTNTLPAEATIVTPANTTNTCGGGTLTLNFVDRIISFAGTNIAAGTVCTIQVEVTSDVLGTHTSQSSELTSSLGVSNDSSATLTVEPFPSIQLNYSAAPDTVPEVGGAVGFNIRVENTSPFEAVTLTSLVDDLRGEVSNSGACNLPQTIAAGATYTCFYTLIESGPAGSSRTSTLTATATDSDDNVATDQDDATVHFLESFDVYLPALANDFTRAPDLIVADLQVSSAGISVTIANDGNRPVVDGFWIDLYINPEPLPTAVNQIWPFLSAEGIVWGVESFDNPTQTLTLADALYVDASGQRLTDFSGVIPAGSTVCVQVDSAGDPQFGGVLEAHEARGEAYNNVTCITVPTTIELPVPSLDLLPPTDTLAPSRP